MAKTVRNLPSKLSKKVVRFLDGTEKLSRRAKGFQYHENAEGHCVLTVEFDISADDLDEKEIAE